MADEDDIDKDGEANGQKPDKMFVLKKWNAVAMWSWDVECDTCAICRVQVMGKHAYEATHCLKVALRVSRFVHRHSGDALLLPRVAIRCFLDSSPLFLCCNPVFLCHCLFLSCFLSFSRCLFAVSTRKQTGRLRG